MFNWYETIKQYYTLGLYNDTSLDVFVAARWITEEQKDEIILENSKK